MTLDRLTDFELYALFFLVPLLVWIVVEERRDRARRRRRAARRPIGDRWSEPGR